MLTICICNDLAISILRVKQKNAICRAARIVARGALHGLERTGNMSPFALVAFPDEDKHNDYQHESTPTSPTSDCRDI